MIINKIKQLNIIKTVSKKTLVIAIAFLVLGLAYSAYASGIIVFRSGGDSLLNLNLSVDNFIEGANAFSDTSGRSNNGTLSNPPSFVNDQNNKENTALNFNGTTDYVLVNNTIVSSPTSLTISAWFKKEVGGSSYECVLHQGSASSIGSTAYWLGLESDDYLNATIGATAGVGWGAGRTTIKANPGQWYHLLATWDGSVVKVYVNGQYNKQYNLGTYSNLSNPTRIGASDNGTTYQFKGAIQNVSIYNRSFSDNEVKDLYNFTQPKLMVSSLQSGLIGHWTLDADDYDDATKRVTDKTPYGNHGINYGASPAPDRNGKTNGAMSFNGLGNKINISYPNPVKQTSVVAWFKKSGPAAGGHHIITGGSYVEVSIPEHGAIRTGVNTNTQGRMVFNSGSGLTDGNWHQVAMTYDGINLKSFIDGLITATNPVSGDLTGPATEIGRYLSDTYAANGSISDVRIYNRAISEGEILSLYDLYQPSISGSSLQKGLVLDMPLTSDWTKTSTPGSEIMIDRTPYANDGVNYGGVVSSEGTLLQNIGNRVATSFTVPNDQGTISIWYKPLYNPSDANRDSILYSTGASWVKNSFAFQLRNCCGAPYDNILYMKDSNVSYLAFEWDRPLGAANEWINLTVVFQSKNYLRLYNNGILVASSWGGNTSNFNFPSVFNVGAINAGSVSAKGTVSNLKIYNRALGATEVLSLYDQGR